MAFQIEDSASRRYIHVIMSGRIDDEEVWRYQEAILSMAI